MRTRSFHFRQSVSLLLVSGFVLGVVPSAQASVSALPIEPHKLLICDVRGGEARIHRIATIAGQFNEFLIHSNWSDVAPASLLGRLRLHGRMAVKWPRSHVRIRPTFL
jgi:hypothetical protein